MAHRQFLDESGAEWEVYEITPRVDERRSHDRRDASHQSAAGEDRRGEDRRAAIETRHPPRLTRGWLCFDNGNDRRRLQPVPADWQMLDDAGLAALLGQARPAPRRAR